MISVDFQVEDYGWFRWWCGMRDGGVIHLDRLVPVREGWRSDGSFMRGQSQLY